MRACTEARMFEEARRNLGLSLGMNLNLSIESDSGHETDALGHAGEERRWRPRKSTGSCQTSVDPYVSEWGNPTGVMFCDL